nr:MAG: SDR family oxidoreductase [Chloroflexota bacterium]
MTEFTDQIVLITGAGRGIGRAIAEAFAAQGAIICANDITPINLDETVARIAAAGGRVKPYVVDIAKRLPIETMVAQILEDWGRIDILINNAGVEPRASILDIDEWDWQRTLDVNLSGPLFAMQQAGRAMRDQGGGVIINIAASTKSIQGADGRAAFVTSKMGLVGLTQVAAREFAPYHIRVNAVCPGGVDTRSGWAVAGQAVQAQPPSNAAPGSPNDVTGLVLYLCSQAATEITGQVIDIDIA